jgi:PBP1b-binding outer membrane lipoprotein LpoB
MKKLLVVFAFFALAGCSTIKDYIPSFWDDNQAAAITNLQQATRHLDCSQPLVQQAQTIADRVEWIDIYSKFKGTRDVAKLTVTFDETLKEFQDRVRAGPVSPMYCDLKKKIFVQQADIIAAAIMGRF